MYLNTNIYSIKANQKMLNIEGCCILLFIKMMSLMCNFFFNKLKLELFRRKHCNFWKISSGKRTKDGKCTIGREKIFCISLKDHEI